MYGKGPRFSIMRQTDDWLDSSGNRVHLSFLKLAETAASGRLGLEEVRKRFIDQMGTHMETEGLPRIAGRLFGLMILELEPISFGDLAHRLGVSRGSISTNSRLIEAKGLIERVSMEGERQDFFRLAEQPYVNMMRGVAARMGETLKSIAEARASLPSNATREDARLQEAEHFFETAVASLADLTTKLCAREPSGEHVS
ncbi:MAG TPA: MarR family transcriptional regulator [Aurantimonas coralicida]|uniref:MarR family transcriptional regulator n=2 Tax=root TaxID=1 RepID=A0A9C9TI79_9HYPH|nr:MarR family transcriptional regulator [Aurantimonas coralicida]HEU02250.1 MarR family transcriptional regulator [Aurantimonas coralicida]